MERGPQHNLAVTLLHCTVCAEERRHSSGMALNCLHDVFAACGLGLCCRMSGGGMTDSALEGVYGKIRYRQCWMNAGAVVRGLLPRSFLPDGDALILLSPLA